MDMLGAIWNAVWVTVFVVFFFGFCIFIHEFGHLLAGLWMGLRVEKFSIGMGKKVWGFTWRKIEFVVSMLPLGGYVSLPQIDLAEPPKEAEGKPLPDAAPGARAVTAFAGPLFNILFGFILATIMWWAGLWVPPASESCVVTDLPKSLPVYEAKGVHEKDRLLLVNGKAADSSLAEFLEGASPDQAEYELTLLRDGREIKVPYVPKGNPEWLAGLRAGDRIVEVNGESFSGGVDEVQERIVYNDHAAVSLTVVRNGEKIGLEYVPEPNPLRENLPYPFFHCVNPPAIAQVQPDSAAARMGLRAGMQVLAVNGVNVHSGGDFFEKLESAGKSESFTVQAVLEGKELELKGNAIGGISAKEDFGVCFPVAILEVLPQSPAERAGLCAGDRVRRADGGYFEGIAFFQKMVRDSEGEPVSFLVERGTRKPFPVMVTPEVYQDGNGEARYMLGVILGEQTEKVLGHPTPWKQFSKIFGQTARTLKLLFSPLVSCCFGKGKGEPERPKAGVGVRHMSGPAGILAILWMTLNSEGIRGGLALGILITFSLGLVNLLPIPVLDGGHILFAFLEFLLRRRLPGKVMGYIQNVFAGLLIVLFLYITFFDGRRIVKYAKDHLTQDTEETGGDSPGPSVQKTEP